MVEGLKKKGSNTIHLPKGEDFSPSGREIESYRVFTPGITKAKGPAWYSSLAKAVESPKFPNRAPAKQMSDVLKSWAKSGEIKQEELDWSGILDRLAEEKDDARWTKDMVLEYLRENNVQIEEVMKGGQTAAESENVAKIAGIIEQYDADISGNIS